MNRIRRQMMLQVSVNENTIQALRYLFYRGRANSGTSNRRRTTGIGRSLTSSRTPPWTDPGVELSPDVAVVTPDTLGEGEDVGGSDE